jgi:hypothetical protein
MFFFIFNIVKNELLAFRLPYKTILLSIIQNSPAGTAKCRIPAGLFILKFLVS